MNIVKLKPRPILNFMYTSKIESLLIDITGFILDNRLLFLTYSSGFSLSMMVLLILFKDTLSFEGSSHTINVGDS